MFQRIAPCLVVSLLFGAGGVGADDLPEFDSENSATSVRELVAGTTNGLLGSITRAAIEELETTPSTEVAQLIAIEGETVRVHGTAMSTYVPQGGSPVILNFGDDFRTCFKVVIYRRNHDHWGSDAAGIAALYDGADLLVEGTVSLYEGMPQIEVIAPTQVRRVADE